MYKPNFRRNRSNVPVLSKSDIDHHAERMVQDFSPALLQNPGELDIDRFLTKYLKFNLEHHHLS